MKILSCLLILAGLLMAGGCCTPQSVAQMKGQGSKRAFDVSYDTTWTTLRSVAVMDDLNILNMSKTSGFISARRSMGETTFGDVVAIWIRPISSTQTEVEVVSRRVGPPVPFAPNEEEAILRSLEEVLTF
jgi:hypothetical protein